MTEKKPSAYVEAGRKMAATRQKTRAAAKVKPPEEEKEAPLPPWLRGDREGRATLPMRPPTKREPPHA